MGPNKIKKIGLGIIVLIIFSSFILNLYNIPLSAVDVNNTDEALNDEKNEMKSDKLKPINIRSSQSSLTEYSGVGLAQNITAFGVGNFINNDINVSNNDNTYFIVPDEWNASEIICNISNIYDHDTEWVNSTFDTGYDSSLWYSQTNFPENVTFGWDGPVSGSDDSIYFRQDEAYLDAWDYVDSYWNLSFYIPRSNNPTEGWELSFNYRYIYTDTDWLTTAAGVKFYAEIQNSGSSQSLNIDQMVDINNNTWYSFNQIYTDPAFQLPGTLDVLLGLYYGQTSGYNPPGYLEIYFDNVSLNIPTIPKPSDINLSINDITNGVNSEINDGVGSVSGTITLQNNWEGDIGGKYHYFNFSSNSSGDIYLDSEFYVKAQSSEKTKIELGDEGTDFIVENNTKATWTQYYTVSIPGTYSNNYYFNMSKPVNWDITELINPYGGNRINDVIATSGPGNTTLVIPNNIIVSGTWKIVAEAPNYVNETRIFSDVSSVWIENNSFQVPELIKVNASIDTINNPNFDHTNATLLIYQPNGSLCYQEKVKVNTFGNVEFTPVSLSGQNTTIGQYTVNVRWNDNDLNMSRVGLKTLHFEITKDSLLKRSNFHSAKKIPAFSGDNILLKVNFTDLYTGEGLADATVNYTIDNATEITGFMIYQGGGIYVVDIDTTGFLIGIYNVTVSAVKSYYSEQHNLELFEIEIQHYTTLVRTETPTAVQMKANATVKYSYNDSYGTGIPGASLSFNINHEKITDEGNGNYIVIFNSGEYTNLGTNVFIANFSAAGYETQINTLQFEIVEQDVNLTVYINSGEISENTLVDLYFQEKLNISARVFALRELIYLSGGEFTFISDNYEENLTESPPTYFNSSIVMDAAYFNPGINYFYISFQQENYTIKTLSFQAFIREQEVNLTVYFNTEEINENTLVDIYFQENINISARAFALGEKIYLSGGLITFISDHYDENLTEAPATYFNLSIIMDGAYFNPGINYVYLLFQQGNYSTKTFSFQLFVRTQSVNITLLINSEQVQENYLVETFFNDMISLSSRAYAETEQKFLANCTITFISDNYEKNLTKTVNYWYNTSIDITTSDFNLGINYVYIRFTRTNYTSVAFSFQILISQISIEVDFVDIEDSVEVFAGETVTIEIKLTESISGIPIEDADISYDWEFGVGEFEEKGDGVYEVEIEIPENIEGNYDLELIISKSGSVYKSSEEDFTITVKERELPEYWIWIIIAALSIGVGLLAAISLRAYVFLPRARRKESELLAKTQNFKDMRSIQAIVLIHRVSGLPVYYKTYSFLEEADAHLFSGFVQAITTIGKEIAESDKRAKSIEKQRKYAEHMMEIDFKYFYALIYDHEDLRIVLILNERSSDELREKLKDLSTKITNELSDSIKNFSGLLEPFELAVPSILSKSIDLHYKEFFNISSDNALFLKTKKEREFSSVEKRLFNVLTSYSKGGKNFALESIFKMISEKDENLIIEAIESLIKRKLIIPTGEKAVFKSPKGKNYK